MERRVAMEVLTGTNIARVFSHNSGTGTERWKSNISSDVIPTLLTAQPLCVKKLGGGGGGGERGGGNHTCSSPAIDHICMVS